MPKTPAAPRSLRCPILAVFIWRRLKGAIASTPRWPKRPEAVHLAALLVRMEGERVVADASSAAPFIERAYALDRARLLAERYAEGQRVWTRPPMPLPEPEPESEPEPVTL